MTEWQPIETAPIKPFTPDDWFIGGPRLLLWDNGVTLGAYRYTEKGKGRWQNWAGNIKPSHWMPLPEAPK